LELPTTAGGRIVHAEHEVPSEPTVCGRRAVLSGALLTAWERRHSACTNTKRFAARQRRRVITVVGEVL